MPALHGFPDCCGATVMVDLDGIDTNYPPSFGGADESVVFAVSSPRDNTRAAIAHLKKWGFKPLFVFRSRMGRYNLTLWVKTLRRPVAPRKKRSKLKPRKVT